MDTILSTKPDGKTAPQLQRQVFSTSRELEYFTERELSMQLGESNDRWPVMLAKELMDNALDACESKGIAPHVQVILADDSFTIADNGPGLPEFVLRDSLNYQVRVSDKAHYVSPSRGQLGNALKCVWAAPFVASGCKQGVVEVGTMGRLFKIVVEVNQIEQKPDLAITGEDCPEVKNGTFVKIHWPRIASYTDDEAGSEFYHLVERMAQFNPHAHFTITGPTSGDWPATSPAWSKWSPSALTSPHWYSQGTLAGLVAAYVANGSTKTVREFVSEFAGLSGSAKRKRVTDQAGLGGELLNALVTGKAIDSDKVKALLVAMREHSRPIKPEALGVLGEDHFRARKLSEAFAYKRQLGQTSEGLPFVVEVAFDVKEEGQREIAFGLNWTATNEDGLELNDALSGVRADYCDPVRFTIHIACPRIEFKDRAKSSVELPPEIRDALAKCIASTGKGWKQIKRNSDREGRARQQDVDDLRREQKRKELTITEAANLSLQKAYEKASGDGNYAANARQIMYAARPLVLELTGGKCWKNSSSFTQTILPDFIRDNPELTADWKVVFDARGTFTEPHLRGNIDKQFGLGTLEVRKYVGECYAGAPGSMSLHWFWQTMGPAGRFKFVLFIEKEGFDSLIESVRIAERFDIAIMSTKGMSVTASRELVESLSEQGVTILVAHDFDKAGFSILHTLGNDTDRYQFKTPPTIVDIGLRLADVRKWKLESEPVEYGDKKDPRENLADSGATEEEQNFLVTKETYNGWTGQRVELNALTAPQFIKWLESKLRENGVEKIVPPAAVVKTAWKAAVRFARVAKVIEDQVLRGS